MLKIKICLGLFLLIYSYNLISQRNNSYYSVTTKIDTSFGCNIFVLNENNIPIDSFYCTPDRNLVLIDYFVPSKDSVSIIYSYLLGVTYENFILKDEIWKRSYSSGLICHTPRPSFWDVKRFGELKDQPKLNEMEFIIEGIDSVKIINDGKVSYVDFNKKIRDRKKWIKDMEKRRIKNNEED